MTRPISRDHLPIASRAEPGLTTYDAKDPSSGFPAIERLEPPAGAPNVLIILLDDVGFGASSAFGGSIDTPVADRLAESGLRLNRFHTTAVCAPTRQALLTGRNHHSVGMGTITETATSAPGYTSVRPLDTAPLPQILNLNGYSTAQFGKCHEVPVWEVSSAGPFHRWPTGSGFDYFYGFIGGESDWYRPALYRNTTPVEPPRTPEEGYHFTEDMTDEAIGWVRQQRAMAPDHPFFMYYAPGATHSPHQVPAEWADRYAGKFDAGWDALREEIFARQKELGVIPPDAELTARPVQLPAWDEMPDELKPVLRRQMEVYAGFLEHTDNQIGRLVDELEQLDSLDNTLIYYIIGDNGAAEGTLNGLLNMSTLYNNALDLESSDVLLANIDKLGGPEAFNNYAVGWAHAMCTPYQWTKQVASHFGGTRNGTIVHWPAGISARGEVRSQFQHVIDVAPTVLDVAGLPQPSAVLGVAQRPMEGVSMRYCFDEPEAPERHDLQYFEMFCNRGIYHRGWTAVTRHYLPWDLAAPKPAFDDDVWELYDTNNDWTQARDLAAEMPEKLAELQRLFLIEATKYNVLPLDDSPGLMRMNPDIAGRPQLVRGATQTLYGGMTRLLESSVLNIKNKSHTVTADLMLSTDDASGVVVSQGGHYGGWSLYMREGRLEYCYNLMGVTYTYVEADAPLSAGAHEVRVLFDYDGGGLGLGATVTLEVDGQEVGSDRLERTAGILFSLYESTSVGVDLGGPVSPHYTGDPDGLRRSVSSVRLEAEPAEREDRLATGPRRRAWIAGQ